MSSWPRQRPASPQQRAAGQPHPGARCCFWLICGLSLAVSCRRAGSLGGAPRVLPSCRAAWASARRADWRGSKLRRVRAGTADQRRMGARDDGGAVGARWRAMGRGGLAVGPQRAGEGRLRVRSRPRGNAWMRATELTGERATVRTLRGDLTGDLVLSHLARKRAAKMNDVCVFSSAAPRPSRESRAAITRARCAVLGLSRTGRRRASRARSGLS